MPAKTIQKNTASESATKLGGWGVVGGLNPILKSCGKPNVINHPQVITIFMGCINHPKMVEV
jgi:hypothetical protein